MTKIQALKKTIYNLENDVYVYNWGDIESCNCGILAKTLLDGKNLHANGIEDTVRGQGGPFSGYGACLTTGINLSKVWQLLKDAGFTHKEMIELEYYGNPIVCEKLGWSQSYPTGSDVKGANILFNNKNNAILYMNAWVKILEEEVPAIEIQKPKEVIKYVTVSPEIKVTVPEYSLS